MICPNWSYPAKKHPGNAGITLIELILYTGLLVVMLAVFYQLFAIAGYQKLAEVVEHELFTNGQHAMFEIQNAVEKAATIDEPLLGATSSTLKLDGGATVFTIVGNQIVKTVGVSSASLTSKYVIPTRLEFSQLGPSVDSPTITISIDLQAKNNVEGRIRTETFTSSVSLR